MPSDITLDWAPPSGSLASGGLPLVIDLDGTLVRSELLFESYFDTAILGVRHIFRMLSALRFGKTVMQRHLADASALDYATLPYDGHVLDLIRQAKAEGRKIYLATASDSRHAEGIVEYLGLFDGYFASDGETNLSGGSKAEALVAAFGEEGFDYVGNAAVDLPVWNRSRKAFVVRAPSSVLARLATMRSGYATITSERPSLDVWVKALRIHQYAKNVLVFVPLVTAHRFAIEPFLTALLAFAAFSACASATYIVNDLLDLKADRRHPSKANRPFASGRISIRAGMIMAPALLFGAVAMAIAVSWAFAAVIGAYFILTSMYSFFLKRKMLIDTVVLAMLYTIRVIGGAIAIHVVMSEWLLAFSLLMFTSLALTKRYVELAVRLEQGLSDPSSRNYRKDDMSIVASLAAAASMNAVTIFALYISSAQVVALYARPDVLWLIVPLLVYWSSRTLMMAHRRLIDDDPIVFAARDWNSWAVALLVISILVIAT
ncbi:MAG: UbiA family prenyltransferase [Methylocella sp.]